VIKIVGKINYQVYHVT